MGIVKTIFKAGSIMFYMADGSKPVAGIGSGVWRPQVKIREALGEAEAPTVFQTVISPIDFCVVH